MWKRVTTGFLERFAGISVVNSGNAFLEMLTGDLLKEESLGLDIFWD